MADKRTEVVPREERYLTRREPMRLPTSRCFIGMTSSSCERTFPASRRTM
jgi:hypothetical protein